MQRIFFLITVLILFTLGAYSQSICNDSSYRVKYIFGDNGAQFYNVPDTTGKNFFAGSYINAANTQRGIALMKTDWGDSIYWAKKFYNAGAETSFSYNLAAPGNTRICTGMWYNGGGSASFVLISRIDDNGNMLWAKTYKCTVGGNGYTAISRKNVLVTSNAIYVSVFSWQTSYNLIFKLDLDGNILWSKSLKVNAPAYSKLTEAPVFFNNALYVTGAVGAFPLIVKLNDADGSLQETTAYKVSADPLITNLNIVFFNGNNNGTFSLTGFASTNTGPLPFNILLDANFDQVSAFAYRVNFIFSSQNLQFEFNHLSQHAMLGYELFSSQNKYFITFGSQDQVLRSRKFVVPGIYSGLYSNSVNLDDKQNLHFLYHNPTTIPGTPIITEYARISNFAPDGTVGCFGKDTSIFTPYPFNITKEHFTWDSVGTNLVAGTDVSFIEEDATVTKQLVCKIVSYCDSVHINGPAAACIGQPVRYTVSKNSGCLKNLDWVIDTSFANIINTEGDSAITLSFKKAFTGYIHAAITDCVVKDSFFVTVLPSPVVKLANRDSLLCPGKTTILNATPGFAPYLWQDGSTMPSYTVNSPGFYKVTGTSYCSIQSSDSIVIQNSDTSLSIPFTQTICKYDTAYISLPNDVNNITWQPNGNSLLNNKTLLLFPQQTTVYNITAERLVNCAITKTTEVVIKICPQIVFIPNAFTPNNDGLNDVFRATPARAVQFFNLIIYNRYGQKVFETNNSSKGWDGTFKGSSQPTGGYMYHCSYRFTGGLQRTESGYLILIR